MWSPSARPDIGQDLGRLHHASSCAWHLSPGRELASPPTMSVRTGTAGIYLAALPNYCRAARWPAAMVRHRRLSHTLWPMGIIKGTCNGNEVLFEMDTLNVYGGGPHSHPKHEFRIRPHFRYLLGGVIVSHFGVVWEMYGKSLLVLFSPRNVGARGIVAGVVHRCNSPACTRRCASGLRGLGPAWHSQTKILTP